MQYWVRCRDGSDIQVYFVKPTILLASRRTKIWTEKILLKGGTVTQDKGSKSITHVVVGDGDIPPELDLPNGCQIISVEWLEQSFTQGKRLPSKDFVVSLEEASPLHADALSDVTMSDTEVGPMRKFEPWLGHWEPDFDHITDTVELVLQGRFSAKDSLNEPVVAKLMELCKYEAALEDEHGVDKDDGTNTINRKALQYSRAAAVVRGCAYKIGPELVGNELPFLGPSTARIVCSILQTGTSPELEAFRMGEIVQDSRGRDRPDTVGANVRWMFKKLPAVGVGTAKAWYDVGFRSFEDVAEAAQQDAKIVWQGRPLFSTNQLFSLKHRQDLLEDCPPDDIQEMSDKVLSTLNQMSGPGWQIYPVGAQRRSGKASHDADFVVSHPTRSTEGACSALVKELIEQGRMVAPSQGMCLLQQGRMPRHMESLRTKGPEAHAMQNLQADRFDRIVGTYITNAGHVRRCDVIVSPHEELAFCIVSWTGSKQFCRFLRQYAVNRGMTLNAHRLMRKDKGSWWVIPDDLKPLDRTGGEFWPPGWPDDKRSVDCERDIFDLLEVPWREPWERDCP